MFKSDLTLREVLGLNDTAAREAWLAVRGEPGLPPSKFGLSSVRLFRPRLAAATWRGRRVLHRRVPIVTLFNRTPTPVEQGWSVRVSQVRDFRGQRLTYDSHNGTDFAVPPGTRVVAAAPGRIVARRQEYNRGGLKLYIDHGDGMMTSYNHLARTLGQLGDEVRRGQPVALSGYSGIDALASFGTVPPHVHFNVFLGGVQVDPFAAAEEISLWHGGKNRPQPATPGLDDEYEPTSFAAVAVQTVEQQMRDRRRQAVLGAISDLSRRAWELTIEANTYPTRFDTPEAARPLFSDPPRAPRLTLPFCAEDFDDVAFIDELQLS